MTKANNTPYNKITNRNKSNRYFIEKIRGFLTIREQIGGPGTRAKGWLGSVLAEHQRGLSNNVKVI